MIDVVNIPSIGSDPPNDKVSISLYVEVITCRKTLYPFVSYTRDLDIVTKKIGFSEVKKKTKKQRFVLLYP